MFLWQSVFEKFRHEGGVSEALSLVLVLRWMRWICSVRVFIECYMFLAEFSFGFGICFSAVVVCMLWIKECFAYIMCCAVSV